jgi:hypothetical protein
MMAADRSNHESFVVRSGFLRTAVIGTVLVPASLVFLFVALVMLFISVDNLLGRAGLWFLALVFAALAAYFLLIVSMLATRVEVGPKSLLLRVPNWRGGVMPWFPWIRTELPYDQLAAVETRDEVNSSFGIPMVQTAYSLVTKDGRRIVFGYTSPLSTWNYRFDEAAARIARNANLAVRARGAVAAGGITRSIVKGLPGWEMPAMSPEKRERAIAGSQRAMQAAFLLAVIALSIKACVPEHY